MEITKLDQKGIDFLINEEGIVLHPYLDKAGIPTIGIGNTYYPNGLKVKMTDPSITRVQAIDMFRTILKNYELAVYSTTRDDINQNQFNALVSLCYNIGVNGFKNSSLLKVVNQNPNDPILTSKFSEWRKSGGKIDSVLVGRRKREAKLYFS